MEGLLKDIQQERGFRFATEWTTRLAEIEFLVIHNGREILRRPDESRRGIGTPQKVVASWKSVFFYPLNF